MRTEFLCVSVLRVASGPRVKLASCKSALNTPVVCSTDRSKAVVPVLVLLFVALWFILRVWEGLRFVIVALPGLFSYLFLHCHHKSQVSIAWWQNYFRSVSYLEIKS